MEVAEYINKRKAEKAERDSALTDSTGSQSGFEVPYPGWPAPGVQCRCGHMAKWERFNEDGLGQELPPNTFRCPSCGWQWQRLQVVEHFANGDYARTKIEIRYVEIPFL